jgi:surfactin synthase thioesterase subunit
MPPAQITGNWLLHRPPRDARVLILGFPYPGVGASCYRLWPSWLGTAWVGAIQPPGRENRIREAPFGSHATYAADLAAYLGDYADRDVILLAHCGAVPCALETAFAMRARGLPGPRHLIASSWGAPRGGPYGRLAFLDLERADLSAEVTAQCAALGIGISPDLAAIGARVLSHDLAANQAYRYEHAEPIPCPVTVVGWSEDDVVPPELTLTGWEDTACVRYRLLEGGHFDLLRCPPSLRQVLQECA